MVPWGIRHQKRIRLRIPFMNTKSRCRNLVKGVVVVVVVSIVLFWRKKLKVIARKPWQCSRIGGGGERSWQWQDKSPCLFLLNIFLFKITARCCRSSSLSGAEDDDGLDTSFFFFSLDADAPFYLVKFHGHGHGQKKRTRKDRWDGERSLQRMKRIKMAKKTSFFFLLLLLLSVSPWHTHLTSRSVKRTFEIIKKKRLFFL